MKLWVNPPDELYLQGDIAFDATGLVAGSNAEEFWFWLRPKEISSYWWGRWSRADSRGGFSLNLAVLLEAFGLADVAEGDWSLTRGRFDVLWLHSEDGILSKRVYIEPCDYVVAEIEYFDSSGEVVVRAEFADHKQIAEGFFVPKRIEMTTFGEDGREESAEISLDAVRPAQFNEEQRQRLFVRPEPRGFEHVYMIIDGRAVEQIYE